MRSKEREDKEQGGLVFDAAKFNSWGLRDMDTRPDKLKKVVFVCKCGECVYREG